MTPLTIYLCYGYAPYTTAVYFEKAFKELGHRVYYVGPPYRSRSGFEVNADVSALIRDGMPEPDLLLFIETGRPFFPNGIEFLSCPTACYLIDVHISFEIRERYAPFFDYVFVAQKDYVELFRKSGYENTFWLPLACDPDIHMKCNETKIYDVGFVGKLIRGSKREVFLNRIARICRVNDFRRYYPKEEIAEVYSRSRIVFNESLNGDLNMRVFEGLCSGALLVTEKIENGQGELFREKGAIVEYETIEEAEALIRYFLQNERERETIARIGHKLVLAHHTYTQRCSEIISRVFDTPTERNAAVRKMSFNDIRKSYLQVWRGFGHNVVDPTFDEFEKLYKTGTFKGLSFVLKALQRRFRRIRKQRGKGIAEGEGSSE
jgi:hypothetical protein